MKLVEDEIVTMERSSKAETDVVSFMGRYTDKVIRNFVEHRYDGLVRKAVHAMQRVPACGFYDDREHQSLWDDYCHRVQNAPDRGTSEYAWRETLHPILDGIVEAVPAEDAALLSLSAFRNLDDDLILNGTGIRVLPKAIRENLEERLVCRARLRNISRFIPKLFR